MQLFLLRDIYWNIILLRRYQAKHRIAPWLGGWHKLQAHHHLGICICRGRPYSSSLNLSSSNIVLLDHIVNSYHTLSTSYSSPYILFLPSLREEISPSLAISSLSSCRDAFKNQFCSQQKFSLSVPKKMWE